jgi:hypothetical protein
LRERPGDAWERVPFQLEPHSPVIVYLQSPKEKVWGLLVSFDPAGIVLRGLDLAVFEDWMRQEARSDESLIAPTTLFYPMHRVERMERDETSGSLPGYVDRFALETGRTVRQAMGLDSET